MAVISTDDSDDVDVTWVRFGSIPLIVTLVLPLILGVFILLKCILNHCCVRKNVTKDEMYGLEGRMTILSNAESSFVASPPHPQQQQPVTNLTSNQTSPIPNTNINFQQIKQPKRQQKGDNRHLSQQSPSLKSDGINGAVIIPSSPTPTSSSSSSGTTTIITTTVTAPVEAQTCDSYETVDLSDSLKRSTLHRQLPDLPQLPNLQIHNQPRRSSSVLSHDGTSELYATVGETHLVQSLDTEMGINNYYNVASARKSAPVPSSSRGSKKDGPSTSGSSSSHVNKKNSGKSEPTPLPSSDSETYSGAVVNHPYAKLKRNIVEHPYARVRTGSTGAGDEETDTDNYDTPQPYAQTRTRNPPTSSRPLTALQSNNNAHSSSHGNGDGVSQPSLSSASSSVNNNDSNPVPPRRTGRQWRRSSHPQAQPNNDNQPNFSGDSQDSRGYTSISVREPLSNIIANRNQVANTRRTYDSHYATVSDDSEEMYAAIEDPDGNYMRIPGEDRHWIGGPHLASPIPEHRTERREANSPLPPPPIPPLVSEISPTAPLLMDGSQSSGLAPVNPNPPLYAQVTKKNKKGKAPLTPTMSAPPTIPSSSQANNSMATNEIKVSSTINPTLPSPGTSGVQIQTASMKKNRHTVSENTTTLLSSIEPTSSEPRRWSKADISYSEFEVVREPTNIRDFGHPLIKSDRSSSSSSTPHHHHIHHISTSPPPPPLPQHKSIEIKNISGNLSDQHKKQEELLDEDNYNVIPEPGRLLRHGSREESGVSKSHSSSKSSSKKIHKMSTNSDNYQEIEDVDFHISNAYQEIERQEPSDYYQEIGAVALHKREGSDSHHDESSTNLYQEIDKKKPRVHVSVELLDDEEDQFYETVKPASSSKPKFTSIPSPSHSQASMSSLDRKHGYEKLRKKVSPHPHQPPPVLGGIHHHSSEVNNLNKFDDDEATTEEDEDYVRDTNRNKKTNLVSESSKKKQRFTYEEHRRQVVDSTLDEDEDDDEDDAKNEESMYERVKYPPYKYERLKESKDDLREIDVDDERRDRNLYEDIGYSRVIKPKSKNAKKLLPNTPLSFSESPMMPSQNHSRDDQMKIKNSSQVQDIEAKDFPPVYSSKTSHNQIMLDGEGGGAGDNNQDLDQLYARIDKSKKRKHNINKGSGDGEDRKTTTAPTTSSSTNTRIEESPQACILLRTDREEDNSIEYI